MSDPVFVKFWGARGSIPTPGPGTQVYGGNTACVEIRHGGQVYVCDAGSGMRNLGKDMEKRADRPKLIHLFISHTHWDHIQGFPFFAPAYLDDTRIVVYGVDDRDADRYRLLSGQMMNSDYFPVNFSELDAHVVEDRLDARQKTIGGLTVRAFPLEHSGNCFAYSFASDAVKIVYATDHEMKLRDGDRFPDPDHRGPLRSAPPGLVDFASGADLLIMDAQYDDERYAIRKNWGHSSCVSITDFGVRAKVKNLAFFHHDPESEDDDVDARVGKCRARAASFGATMRIFGAREMEELTF